MGLLWKTAFLLEHSFVKLEVELVQLLNPLGQIATGENCDSTSDCDPELSVFLDTTRALMAWPGDKAPSDYAKFYQSQDHNSPIINRNVSRVVCGGSVNKVNLRVHVVDEDNFSANDLIEDFQCIFSVATDDIAINSTIAGWSATQNCEPVHQNSSVRDFFSVLEKTLSYQDLFNDDSYTLFHPARRRLLFRYRIYDVAEAACGLSGKTFIREGVLVNYANASSSL